MKKSINIDWLQLNCFFRAITSNENYEVIEHETGTSMFKKRYDIKDKNKKLVATYVGLPHSSALPSDLSLLKIQNNLLYEHRTDLKNYVTNFTNSLNLTIKKISRIDICMDFNRFNDKRHPQIFVKSYISDKTRKAGKTSGAIRFDNVTKRTNRKMFVVPNGLKFGDETSELSYNLYNKTQEMERVKLKPYINTCALENKLDITDLWRLEFSIKSNNTHYYDEDGIFYDMSSLDILEPSAYNNVYFALCKTYFKFAINTNKSRFDREKLLQLFDTKPDLSKFKPEPKKDTTRADKIFIKKLKEHNDEMRGTPMGEQINKFLIYQVENRLLHDWYEKKLGKIPYENQTDTLKTYLLQKIKFEPS